MLHQILYEVPLRLQTQKVYGAGVTRSIDICWSIYQVISFLLQQMLHDRKFSEPECYGALGIVKLAFLKFNMDKFKLRGEEWKTNFLHPLALNLAFTKICKLDWNIGVL